MPLSPKQEITIRDAVRRFNIWVGAIRSGKTFSSILTLLAAIKSPEVFGEVMIIGVNRATIPEKCV